MVWCTMILAQYVIVQHLAGRTWDETTRDHIVRHFEATRTPDGNWGLHPESAGYVFTTTLAYVALRLLGLGPEHPLLVPARRWLHAQPGGVLAVPTWGKFWLALLGLYDYRGLSPCPPELYLFPEWLPFHPRRFYCHTRAIYMAMAFLHGCRFQAPLSPLLVELRRELYATPYSEIDFAAHRFTVAPSDLHVRPGLLVRLAARLLALYERRPLVTLRRRALDFIEQRLIYEQRTSRYQSLSPVSGLLNCLAFLARSPDHPELRPSLEGLESWRWEDEAEGLRYAGARSQSWDTAFAVQAILAAPRTIPLPVEPLRRAYRFLAEAQVRAELPDYQRAYRDAALGGWCFSDGRHQWPVSDCTAEALSVILAMHDVTGLRQQLGEPLTEDRLRQAAEFILSRQNADGGFGTYERRRGWRLLEAINPSEMFGQCMTELSYVECTGSALGALAHFRKAFPGVLQPRLDRAMTGAVRFLRRAQRSDGSFAGFWGINFTYAIFHVVRGLSAAGVPVTDPVLARAAAWLVGRQRTDGGWGEHHTSCLTGRYVEHPESQVVMTSWALLALMDVLGPRAEPVLRGVRWLRDRQRADGSWPAQAVTGVFFGTAMLDYRLYRCYFPVWALAQYAALTASPRSGGPVAGADRAPR